MRTIGLMMVGVMLTAGGTAVLAQDEDPAELYTYATYFECSGGSVQVADDAIAAGSERMNGLVEDGDIVRWGWLTHNTGGKWQRAMYYQAESLDALLDGGDAVAGVNADDAADDEDGSDTEASADEAAGDDSDAEAGGNGDTFGSVCNQHDDYIWKLESGSNSDQRGSAGFSVYLMCDSSREERADEIFSEHVAPILNELVEDGSLASWGWQSHVVGGKFRRLQTMTGSDHKALLSAREKAIEKIYADDNEMGAELNDICGDHVDYMWDITHES